MDLISNISATTPSWAARGFLFLNGIFGLVVLLQENDVIDILPIDPARKEVVKTWVSIAVMVGGTYFVTQKKTEPVPAEPKNVP